MQLFTLSNIYLHKGVQLYVYAHTCQLIRFAENMKSLLKGNSLASFGAALTHPWCHNRKASIESGLKCGEVALALRPSDNSLRACFLFKIRKVVRCPMYGEYFLS